MRIRMAILAGAALCLPALAAAQTKISGTVSCAKPEQEYSIPVEGQASHVYVISHGKCTWTRPMEIAGSKTKEDVFTNFDEVRGDEASRQGSGMITLISGEQTHVRIEGKALLKAGAPQSGQGTWKFQGGTGSLKALKGGGTYTCKGAPEGLICEVTGEYSLPK